MTGCGNAVGRGLGARLSGNNEFSKLKNRDTRRRAPGSENPSTDTEWTAAAHSLIRFLQHAHEGGSILRARRRRHEVAGRLPDLATRRC